METLGVYIQIPFCASKCSFCNFSSRVVHPKALNAYGRAVQKEIERLPEYYAAAGIGQGVFDLPLDTLYAGGGTPTLLGAERLGWIVEGLQQRFRRESLCEFTLEVTPGSADDDFLKRARGRGVNRLSIGAQSFNNPELRAVGRLHSSKETHQLVHRARRAGFTNISLDLIAGLPYQTENSWLATLRTIPMLQPEHISVYLFEIDEKSRLGKEILNAGTRYHAGAVPSEDFMADAYETARQFLSEHGYVQYELSNFARVGYESRHNQRYWQLKPYVGIGAGAHSFDGDHRWANETIAEVYEEEIARGGSPIANIRALSPTEQLEEFFFLGLRQREGVNLTQANRRWGHRAIASWEMKISSLIHDGWLERHEDRLRLPEQAYLVSNEVFQEFLIS